MRPKVLVVQHDDECPPAWFGEWLLAAGCTIDVRHPYAGEPLPETLSGHQALLVLGGPMNANDDDRHPWLATTKQLFREAVSSDVAALGICLGHQICAVALGGEVIRNPRGQQLGLVPVGWLPAAETDPFVGALTGVVHGVQWNDDIVAVLPDGAQLLAETGAGEIQVARYAPTVWGVQLHPEADDRVIRPWAEEDAARYDDDRVAVALAAVAGAREQLEEEWRPLASALARLAG